MEFKNTQNNINQLLMNLAVKERNNQNQIISRLDNNLQDTMYYININDTINELAKTLGNGNNPNLNLSQFDILKSLLNTEKDNIIKNTGRDDNRLVEFMYTTEKYIDKQREFIILNKPKDHVSKISDIKNQIQNIISKQNLLFDEKKYTKESLANEINDFIYDNNYRIHDEAFLDKEDGYKEIFNILNNKPTDIIETIKAVKADNVKTECLIYKIKKICNITKEENEFDKRLKNKKEKIKKAPTP